MKKTIKVAVLAVGAVALAQSAWADFSGYYAVDSGNWSVVGVQNFENGYMTYSPPGTTPFINVNLVSNAAYENELVTVADFVIRAQGPGSVRMNYTFSVAPSAVNGHVVSNNDRVWFLNDLNNNGTFEENEITTLTGNVYSASGSVWQNVAAGRLFGFRLSTDNSTGSNETGGQNTIFLTSFTAPVPEPSVWMMNGVVVAAIGSLGFLQYRRRQA